MRFRICFLVMGITACLFDGLFGGSALHRFNEIEPVASFVGTRKYERVGYAMGAAGDVNNDGYDDFLIGTFHSGYRGHDAGAAYLVLGRPSFDWGHYCHLDNADARFLGKQSYDAVGSSVTGGDLNGDGYSDIIIGAPAGNPAVSDNPGWVYVVFG
ncbi:FG-GAP repeat protein, partial [bacterium]|nr:FG-GAP repeat protein [bacterium]